MLLPEGTAVPQLRSRLLEAAEARGFGGLLGPRFTTLPAWLDDFLPETRPRPSPEARELLLIEALQRHPDLCGPGGPWTLAASLLELFDELAAAACTLPADEQAFLETLRRGYALDPARARRLEPLSREAALVHRLWQAWQVQLEEEGLCDPQRSYGERLAASLDRLSQTPHQSLHFYLAGVWPLRAAEARWLHALLGRGRLTWLLQGRDSLAVCTDHAPLLAIPVVSLEGADSEADDFGRFLDSVFALSQPHGPSDTGTGADESRPSLHPNPEQRPDQNLDQSLNRRARAFARAYPRSPARARLLCYAARDPEDEARAVELQVRRWLLAGKAHIGIVCEDRRLARRVRALLERAGVPLQDHAGWALSTSRAAATVERLLQCAEEDYAHEPMLDLLKSPFLFPDLERDERLHRVHRLERDIILHENVGRNLDRYRRHLALRCERLQAVQGQAAQQVKRKLDALLDRLEAACAPLQAVADGRSRPALRYLDALDAALEACGLQHTLEADAAGIVVLDTLAALRRAAGGCDLHLRWIEFRIWLGRALENASFIPPQTGGGSGGVHLIALSQSTLLRFDALILAAADATRLPGAPPADPFFNDAVRTELGLPSRRRQRQLRFLQFRRLLESAPCVLLTHRLQEEDNPLPASPWVELLNTFHRLAYGHPLDGDGLEALLRDPATEVVWRDGPAPAPARMPRPPAVPELLPRHYTAASYQCLVDCPYRFHAAHCLELAAPERIREALEKADYGARIHRILERYHDPKAPRDGELRRGALGEALQTLERLSYEEFRRDLEDNVLHRGWLRRWLDKLPEYLKWQERRCRTWHITAVEHTAERQVETAGPGQAPVVLQVAGRLDRLERQGDQYAIVDYKTGSVPKREEVLAGEAVQLPFYALLAQVPVREVLYLRLDGDRIKDDSRLEGEELAHLQAATLSRLAELHRQLQAGAALPAWGDDGVCRYCPMSGLCRRQAWIAPEPGTESEIERGIEREIERGEKPPAPDAEAGRP